MPRFLPLTADEAMRDRKFWALLAAIVLAQIVAFWMLCNSQVHRAEQRSTESQVASVPRARCAVDLTSPRPGGCLQEARSVPVDSGLVAVRYAR
jgi:hypothetical protein